MEPYDGGTFIAKREKFSQNELILDIGSWEEREIETKLEHPRTVPGAHGIISKK